MCIFCGDMSDPFHGLGPAPLMVGTIVAGRAWRRTIRPALVRVGKLKAVEEAPAVMPRRPSSRFRGTGKDRQSVGM